MENRKIFIAVDVEGFELLLSITNEIMNNELDAFEGRSHYGTPPPPRDGKYCMLIPPSYMDCFEDEEIPDGFYEWITDEGKTPDLICDCLKKLISDSGTEEVPVVESDNEFFSRCLHDIADELPVPGSCILEVFVLAKKKYFSTRNLRLISALKRFEVSHQAYFGILSDWNTDTPAEELSPDWLNFIDFNCLSRTDLEDHLKTYPVWSGAINVKLENAHGNIPLGHYFLHPTNESQRLFDMDTLQHKQKKITLDSKIDIVAMVTSEILPFHMINPHKFTMKKLQYAEQDTFNFFDVHGDSNHVYFLAFLKYDVCDDSNKFSTADWISYVTDPFTHYISSGYCQQTFNNHCTLIFGFDKIEKTINAYFFKMPDNINVAGFLKLQRELGNVSEDQLNVPGTERTFYKNGADVIPSWEWCEKNSWHEEENLSKVVKSISRCKSDELFLNGVMVPGVETVKDKTKHDFLGSILTLFDKNGQPVLSNLSPIPVLDDRLLKNIKRQSSLTDLNYSSAKKHIGHGLDYCIDSLGSVHLSERLSRVQKRLVPEDTINFTSGKFTVREEAIMAGLKKSVPKNKGNKSANNSKKVVKKKESRAEKHKRRLKTIVEGTVSKYGHVQNTHRHYEECCNTLFGVCVALVKTLKSSKDLNDNMKQFSKSNVSDVVKKVLTKHGEA